MNVVDLRDFYETSIGHLAADLLSQRLKRLAPADAGQTAWPPAGGQPKVRIDTAPSRTPANGLPGQEK